MKMRDLVKRTGVSRESIHYYTREGLLPDIEKPSPNQAIYNETHVERILFIKKLLEKHFLPIPLIKKIIAGQEDSPFDENLLEIKSDYFTPADHFLPQQIKGEKAFLGFTGMSAERLDDFEKYGIITPDESPGGKVYSHDAVKIGKLIGDMRKRGLSHENGFSRTGLKEIRDLILPIIEHIELIHEEGVGNSRFTDEEIRGLTHTAIELFPLFMYYMSRTLLKKRFATHLEENQNEAFPINSEPS